MTHELTWLEKFVAFRRRYFPERQLFLRSEGRVRFVTIGSYTQMVVSAALVVATGWGLVTSYAYLTRDFTLAAKNRTISNMSAQYEALSNDFSALELEVERRAEQLETRQRFLEEMVGMEENAATQAVPEAETSGPPLPGQNAQPSSTKENSGATLLEELLGTGTARAAVHSNVDRRRHLLQRLRGMEYRQQQLASTLLAKAQNRFATIETILAPTKLNNDMLLSKAEHETTIAAGGPYMPEAGFEPVFNTEDTQLFTDLMAQRQRLEMVTMVLDSFPVGKPAEKYYLSSRFGRRRDPLKKTWANHPGLDLAGWPGTAIYATAPGKVVHAGWFGPYGQMVEIDHGNGFRTRYGHMRKLRVEKGDEVDLGHQVGDMGKTGRVTGTHLHYEVWFDGKVRDPMPFMKAANDVLEIQGRNEKTSQQ